MSELTRLTRIAPATIKAYIKRGLLAPAVFRGTATRYPRGHLFRLLAVLYLKAEGVADLGWIQRRLEAWSTAEIEAWVRKRPLRTEVLRALQVKDGAVTPPTPATATTPPAPTPPTAPAVSTPQLGVAAHSNPATAIANGHPQPFTLPATEAWQRLSLLPGLELAVRADASPLVQRVAERLYAAFESIVARE